MGTSVDGGRLIAGRYALKGVIGRGGMSSVWLGRDLVLERDVALKPLGLLPGQEAPDFARAEREARLAARLDHAHVVAVFDLLEDGGEQWLVMEHVNGRNLAQLVADRGPLPPDSAARLLGQAADALTAAHHAGIVHRDVKPSNILVTPEGQVKLTDFGIARAYSDPTLTVTGVMTGSPAYLAPEVASGHQATSASDVWALGATLFHALTGEPPYDARGNVMGALYRIVNEEPPRPANSGWLAPVLERTMAKDPAARWSMDEVRERLVRRDGDAPTRPLTSFARSDEPTKRSAAAAAVAAGAGAAAAASAKEAAPQPPPQAARTRVSAPEAAPVPGPEPGSPSVLSFTQSPRSIGDPPPRRRLNGVLLGALALLVAALVSGAALFTDLGGDDASNTAGAGGSEESAPSTPGDTPQSDPTQDPTQDPTPDPAAEPTPEETPTEEPTGEPTEEPTEEPTQAPTQDSEEQAPPASEGAMRDFVENYYATVTRDPATTWAQLTPGFQATVGSYDSYRGYWSTIAEVEAESVDADADAMTVSFTMKSERTDGSEVEEPVTLLLERTDGGYLIAGQS